MERRQYYGLVINNNRVITRDFIRYLMLLWNSIFHENFVFFYILNLISNFYVYNFSELATSIIKNKNKNKKKKEKIERLKTYYVHFLHLVY